MVGMAVVDVFAFLVLVDGSEFDADLVMDMNVHRSIWCWRIWRLSGVHGCWAKRPWRRSSTKLRSKEYA